MSEPTTTPTETGRRRSWPVAAATGVAGMAAGALLAVVLSGAATGTSTQVGGPGGTGGPGGGFGVPGSGQAAEPGLAGRGAPPGGTATTG